MKQVKVGLRLTAAMLLGMAAALMLFGLLLAAVWAPASAQDLVYKTVSLLAVTAVAFAAGGFLSGITVKRQRVLVGSVTGLLFGFVSFGYVLGWSAWLLLAVVGCGLLGAAGGRLAQKMAVTQPQSG